MKKSRSKAKVKKPKAKKRVSVTSMDQRRHQRASGVRIVLCIHHHHHRHHHWWHYWRTPMGVPATVSVGHTVTATYQITDQNGNPMLTQPPLDSPAVWTDAPNPTGADTNAVSADGTTDVVTAVAAGSDTIGVTVIVGGATFTDSALITISPAPQVASGVQILTTVA